jgi:hypothetical protein
MAIEESPPAFVSRRVEAALTIKTFVGSGNWTLVQSIIYAYTKSSRLTASGNSTLKTDPP